jgi:hypothetical protein
MWLTRTRQRWKAILFLLLALADLCLFGMLIWRINHRGAVSTIVPDEVTLSLSFVVLGIITFSWLWFSIRCAECKTGVAAYVLTHAPASDWFTTLLTLTRCPNCQSSGSNPPFPIQ